MNITFHKKFIKRDERLSSKQQDQIEETLSLFYDNPRDSRPPAESAAVLRERIAHPRDNIASLDRHIATIQTGLDQVELDPHKPAPVFRLYTHYLSQRDRYEKDLYRLLRLGVLELPEHLTEAFFAELRAFEYRRGPNGQFSFGHPTTKRHGPPGGKPIISADSQGPSAERQSAFCENSPGVADSPTTMASTPPKKSPRPPKNPTSPT